MAYKKNNFRSGRIAEEIKRIISDMLLRDLRDPAFGGLVSISAVKASGDGSFATVFVTTLASTDEATDEEKKSVIGAFERSKGLIRREIGGKLGIKHVPDLRFKFDTSEEYGRHIEKIIGELGIEPESGANSSFDPDPGSSDIAKEKPMNTFSEIANVLAKSKTVRIFTHENMDGDTFGSSVALCLALRSVGMDCAVVIGDKIPSNISFVEYGCTVHAADLAEDDLLHKGYDLAILMDLAETSRLSGFENLFANGNVSMCIDHHMTGKPIFDYNYIAISAAATAEIIYELIIEMGIDFSMEMANALYVGIVTDSGRFQYSNTTSHTHRIVANLIDIGMRSSDIAVEIYQNLRLEKLLLENAVVSTMLNIASGKALIGSITRDKLTEIGAIDEEYEGISEMLRGIKGVEVAAFLRETEDGRIKGSLRSKNDYDVAEIASKFGGGGHVRAAGFTVNAALADTVDELRKILEETLN